jgi:hypothetical protein
LYVEEPGDRDVTLEVERFAFGSDEESRIVESIRDEQGSFALVAEEAAGWSDTSSSVEGGSARPRYSRSARSGSCPSDRAAGSGPP